jgi:hypothetical protein
MAASSIEVVDGSDTATRQGTPVAENVVGPGPMTIDLTAPTSPITPVRTTRIDLTMQSSPVTPARKTEIIDLTTPSTVVEAPTSPPSSHSDFVDSDDDESLVADVLSGYAARLGESYVVGN